ncbi:MAG TPA: hypothetical protein VHP33_16255 [Polyangiaceae bacterium]|nr:hypothetical protein [Polyangiaceae bacterium]
MSKVIAVVSVSLDGFVAERADGVAEVFDWYFSGDVPVHTGGSDPMTFKLSKPSAEHVLALTSERGAVLTGRAAGWGERAAPGGRLRRGEVGLRGGVGAYGGWGGRLGREG